MPCLCGVCVPGKAAPFDHACVRTAMGCVLCTCAMAASAVPRISFLFAKTVVERPDGGTTAASAGGGASAAPAPGAAGGATSLLTATSRRTLSKACMAAAGVSCGAAWLCLLGDVASTAAHEQGRGQGQGQGQRQGPGPGPGGLHRILAAAAQLVPAAQGDPAIGGGAIAAPSAATSVAIAVALVLVVGMALLTRRSKKGAQGGQPGLSERTGVTGNHVRADDAAAARGGHVAGVGSGGGGGGNDLSGGSGGGARSSAVDGGGHRSHGPARIPLHDNKPGLEVRVLGPGLVLIKGALNMDEQVAIARDHFYHGHVKQRWWLQTNKVTMRQRV